MFPNKKISVMIGHYGSGKTNLSVNLALTASERGNPVTLVDLDIVNPYFRAADFEELMKSHGVTLVKPLYANTNLDIPAINFDLGRLLEGEGNVILDVGGDDAGAMALGRTSDGLQTCSDIAVYCVVNCYRYLEAEPEEDCALLRDMEHASRMRATALINNSNLGSETTAADIEQSAAYCERLSALTGLPVAFTAVKRELVDQVHMKGTVFPVDIHVKPIWDL